MSHTSSRVINGLRRSKGIDYRTENTFSWIRRDLYDVSGKLSGTVQKLANFVRKRVNLYLEVSGGKRGFAFHLIHLESQWSDSTTGFWEFTRLNPNERYTIIIHDHLNEYDPIIRAGLQPEVE